MSADCREIDDRAVAAVSLRHREAIAAKNRALKIIASEAGALAAETTLVKAMINEGI